MVKIKSACSIKVNTTGHPHNEGGLELALIEQQNLLNPDADAQEVPKKKISKRMRVSREYDSSKSRFIFALADSALAHVDRYFINNVWSFTFLNRKKGVLNPYVVTPELFNRGIVDFKNYLCEQLINYAHLDHFKDLDGKVKLFTINGAKLDENGIPYYTQMMLEFQDSFFDGFDIKQHPSKNKDKFDAFSAFYILNNFDAMIADKLDGIVQIKFGDKGSVNNTNYAKKTEHQSTIYWSDDSHSSHNIDKFTSHLAKFILTTIPKVTEVTTAVDRANGIHRFKQIGDQYLTTLDMFMVSGILKQAEYEFNIIHAKEIAAGKIKPIIFMDEPKVALKRLLTEATEVPVMLRYGFDLTTSFRAFLYQDTADEYSVENLFNRNITNNHDTLDIENLLAFEINKQITPTYVEYDESGVPTLKNYGKSFQSSNRLEENLRQLVYFDVLNPEPIVTTTAYDLIKGKDLKTLLLDKNNLFNYILREVFEIEDGTLPQYQDFLNKHFTTILKICESLPKMHEKVKFVEDMLQFFINVDNFVTNNVESPITSKFEPLKLDANKFLSTLPITNFDNIEGSSIPVYRLGSALFGYNQFITHYQETDPNRFKMNLFVLNPNLLSRYNENPYLKKGSSLINTSAENTFYESPAGFLLDAGSKGNSSEVDKMHPNDQVFISFIGNWLGLRGKSNVFASQLAPYSDKSSIGVVFINQLGEIFNPLDKDKGSRSIPKSLKSYIEGDKAVEIISGLDYYYRKNSKIKLINDILKAWNKISIHFTGTAFCDYLTESELQEGYNSTNSIPSKLLENFERLDKELQKSNLDWDEVSRFCSKEGIELVDNVYYSAYNKKPSCNLSLKWMLNNLKDLTTFRTYLEKLAKRFLESSEIEFLKSRLLRWDAKAQFEKDPIYSDFYKSVIGIHKVPNKDGKGTHDALYIKDEEKFEEILLKYHYANNLIRSLYIELISKDAFADKGSAKMSDEESEALQILESKLMNGEPLTLDQLNQLHELMYKYGELEYSARVAGMAKRMVLYPATVESFTQNTLQGVDPIVHVAIVDDAKELVFNLKGETHKQDIFDGCGFVSVYYSYMENASLPGRGIEGTKKTLGVHTSDSNSALFKWAEYELNNQRIRRSRGNKYELYDLFKKMHEPYKFDENTDITKSLYGTSDNSLETPSKVVNGRRVFFRDGFRYYEVKKIKKAPGDNKYNILLDEVNKYGKTIKSGAKISNVTIDSIFSFWKALGSYNSMELNENGELIFSDINNEIIYKYICTVGSVIDPNKPISRDNVIQPLRNKFISIIANKGAVKRGSSNINSAKSVWQTSGKLATFKVSTKNFGVQLDANHHSDMAELTEMSQTISALAANGYTAHYADDAYTAIADIIKGSLAKVKKQIKNIEEGKIDFVLEQLSRKVIQTLQDESTISTGMSLYEALERELKNSGLILPISDKRFYKLFAKFILQDLNKSSIKRKYTGLGGILNPSSNILLLFALTIPTNVDVKDKLGSLSEEIKKQYLFEDLITKASRSKAFSKEEKLAIESYLDAHPDLDKDVVIAKLLIIRTTNPETDILSSFELTDIALEKYGKWPGYGLKECDFSDVNVLDSVCYYTALQDPTKEPPTQLELSDIGSYTELKYTINPTLIYLNATKPHDLRPLIEHWTCQTTTQETLIKDTWSEPSVFLNYNIEHFLDEKKYKDENKILIAKNSVWYRMLRSLLYTLQFIKDLDSNVAIANTDALLFKLLHNDILAKREIKKIVDNLRMRSAQLHVLGYDFGELKETDKGTFDFIGYFGGLNIDLSKDITKNLTSEKLAKFAKCIDYKVDPAEVIMPKLYRSNFMLGNVNLNDINREYFSHANSYYRNELADKDAKIDFIVRTHIGNFGIATISKMSEIPDIYGKDITRECRFEDGWRLDDDGLKLYKIPNKKNFAIYRTDSGTETIIIRRTLGTYNDIKNIFNSLDSNETSTPIVSILPLMRNLAMDNDTENYIDQCILHNKIQTHNKLLRQHRSEKGIKLQSGLMGIYNGKESRYKLDLGNTLYCSFVKTLEIISTRIPTQALLSFMAMHVAALTDDESNNVFVSRWQLWLQGSDLDIDKSYMMGVDVSNIGTYNHWSPIADYTNPELAKLSDQIPLPSGIILASPNTYWKYDHPIVIESKPSIADEWIKDYIDADLIEDTPAEKDTENSVLSDLKTKYDILSENKPATIVKMKIIIKLLNHIKENNGLSLSPELLNEKVVEDLIDDLNRHNSHILTAAESRNCVANAIRNVSLDGRNMTSGYSPIDRAMALFTEELENHTFSNQLRNLDDSVSIPRIQYENAVGKQDVGIMANGLKAFFAMTQYFNHYWNSEEWKNSDRGKFIRRLQIGKLGDSSVPVTVKETISDILIEETIVRSLGQELQRILALEPGSNTTLSVSNDDASLLISSLVSLATDNAKELALAKLNAGINLACIHVFLTVMGYNAKDIVDYTTSKLFLDFTKIITPSQFDKNAKGKIDKTTWNKLLKLAETEKNYTKEDVEQLHRVYDCAQEMTTLAKLLGINQGIKVNEFDAASFVDKFLNILFDLIKTTTNDKSGIMYLKYYSRGLLDAGNIIPILLKHLGLPATPELVSKYTLKILKVNAQASLLRVNLKDPVDMDRYFNDEQYREFIVDYYDIFKENFNVYDIINHSKHFYQMIEAFNSYVKVFTSTSSRARWSIQEGKRLYNSNIVDNKGVAENENEDPPELYQVPYNFNESIGKRISRIFDDYILSEFLSEESDYDFEMSYKGPIGKTHININYGKGLKKKNPNLSKFIHFVNTVLIPELRRQNPDNNFVRSIRPDLSAIASIKGVKRNSGKTEIGWVFNFNIDRLTDPTCESKYYDVLNGFDKLIRTKDGSRFLTLKDLFPNAEFTKGENIKVADILYLYDLILNVSSFGQGTLDKAFDHYISDNPEIPLRISLIEIEHDKGLRKIELDSAIVMASVLKGTIVHNPKTGGVINFTTDTAPIDLKNSYLLCGDTLSTTANDHYRKCAILLDAIRYNVININTIC